MTDADRFDAALSALARAGVFVRRGQRPSALGRDLAKELRAGRTFRGFLCFDQEAERAALEGGPLQLRFGTYFGGSVSALAGEIESALRAAGLRVTGWDEFGSSLAVSLDYEQRPQPALAISAAEVVAAWADAFVAASVSAVVERADPWIPLALHRAGQRAAAERWTRRWFARGPRALALARLGKQRRSPELVREAWEVAPWDHDAILAQLIALTLHGDDYAREKIILGGSAPDTAAAAQWYMRVHDEYVFTTAQLHHDGEQTADELAMYWAAQWPNAREELFAAIEQVGAAGLSVAYAAVDTAADVLALRARCAVRSEAHDRATCSRLFELGGIEMAKRVDHPALRFLAGGELPGATEATIGELATRVVEDRRAELGATTTFDGDPASLRDSITLARNRGALIDLLPAIRALDPDGSVVRDAVERADDALATLRLV